MSLAICAYKNRARSLFGIGITIIDNHQFPFHGMLPHREKGEQPKGQARQTASKTVFSRRIGFFGGLIDPEGPITPTGMEDEEGEFVCVS